MQQISEDIVRQCTSVKHVKKHSPYQANNPTWQKEHGYLTDREQPKKQKLSVKERDELKEAKLNWRAEMRTENANFKVKQKKYDSVLKSS